MSLALLKRLHALHRGPSRRQIGVAVEAQLREDVGPRQRALGACRLAQIRAEPGDGIVPQRGVLEIIVDPLGPGS